jgi:hypothetical protein
MKRTKGNKKTQSKRRTGNEAMLIRKLIGPFDEKKSPACQALQSRFGRALRRPVLVSIGEIICDRTKLRLNRNEKRSGLVLLKWFHENWGIAREYIERIQLLDENGNVLTAEGVNDKTDIPVDCGSRDFSEPEFDGPIENTAL